MERLRGSTLLLLLVFLLATFVGGQTATPATQDQIPTPASTPSPRFDTPAPPIPANAPRMLRQTRLEIIRDFETQIVYARTVFPMGAKGIKLKRRHHFSQRAQSVAARRSLSGARRFGPAIRRTSLLSRSRTTTFISISTVARFIARSGMSTCHRFRRERAGSAEPQRYAAQSARYLSGCVLR